MRLIIFFLAAMMVLPASDAAAYEYPERHYQERWCAWNGGESEVVLEDRTRVDCLTKTHAIEFDYGRKWAESIGQALHYGAMTGRAPGVVLIIENETDWRYFQRLIDVKKHWELPLTIWNITPDEVRP